MNELGFLHRYVPPTAENSRVLLLLHGTGGDESDLLPLGRGLDPEAALLSPRGTVSENGNARFFRRFAEGVFDEEDVVRRTHELVDFVLAASVKYGFALTKLTAIGYSNGANIAAAILLLRPQILPSAILFRAMVPFSTAPIPDLRGTKTFISSGRHDPIIPLENAERLADTLRTAGAKVAMKVQDSGHELVPADLAVARRWLHA